jgi:hypothetical protein
MFKTFETTKQSQFKETKTAKRAIFIRIFLCFPRFSLFFSRDFYGESRRPDRPPQSRHRMRPGLSQLEVYGKYYPLVI